MVSRCANPSCNAEFKYLHEGHLFQFASAGTLNGPCQSRLNFAFWWLCPRCCTSMTLVQNGPTGVKLILLPRVAESSIHEWPKQMGAAV